jgi:serine/threonine-protein kinase
MGSVWAAAHETLGREVAVKFLQPQASYNHVLTNRFVSEAQMVASIKHRFVVDVFDFGVTDDGLHYMVLELLHGRSLADRMDHGPPMTVGAAVRLMADCLRGLHVVHEAGIIHRDLKPDNIFVIDDADGAFPKLIDFGISRRTDPPNLKLSPTESRKSRLTQPGVVLGTPYYMSPEQLRGKQSVDARSDIYSFGVILYELLAGRLPFRQDNIGDLMVAITVTGAPLLSNERPDLGARLSEVVACAMASAPDQRYGNALQLRQALLDVLADVPEDAMCVVQQQAAGGSPAEAVAVSASSPSQLAAPVAPVRPSVVPSTPATASAQATLADPAPLGRSSSQTLLRSVVALTAGLGLALTLWILLREPAPGPQHARLPQTAVTPALPPKPPLTPTAAAEVAPGAVASPSALAPPGATTPPPSSDARPQSLPAGSAPDATPKPTRDRARTHEGKRASSPNQPQRIYRKLDF